NARTGATIREGSSISSTRFQTAARAVASVRASSRASRATRSAMRSPAFENKHFPGQRSGYIDPGGRMYRMLEALAAPAPAPVPVVPPAPVPPAPVRPPTAIIPHKRKITGGEKSLLIRVFEQTLPYGALEVDVNAAN